MKNLTTRLMIMIGCTGLALSGLGYSQTTLFGDGSAAAGQGSSSDTVLSPDQFRQQVKQLNKQTDDRLANETRNILPPPKDEDKKDQRFAPRRQQQPGKQYGTPPPQQQQQQPGGGFGQPSPPRDVYTGFGNQPQQQQQQRPQPRQQPRQQQQPSGGNGGWNINY